MQIYINILGFVTYSKQTSLESCLLGLANANQPDFLTYSTAVLASLRLDVLLFAEMGMHAFTSMMGNYRLAPHQLVFWGHPISQGLHHVDYMISSEGFEENPSRMTKHALR